MKLILLPIIAFSLLFGDYTRDSNNDTVYDDTTNLTWMDDANVSSKRKNWEEAIDYCNALEFADQNDWRLPNINEINSLIALSGEYPSIYLDSSDGVDNDNGFENIYVYSYWSSTTYAEDSNIGWYVDFQYGNNSIYTKPNAYYVRCVRDGKIGVNMAPIILLLLE